LSKIQAFITYILPLLLLVGLAQIFLLAFKTAQRKSINFAIFSMLAISSIRPNILGESFGLIGPLYFLILIILSKSMQKDYSPEPETSAKLRNVLMALFVITFTYWIAVLLISSFRTYPVSTWVPIANLGTVGLDGYFLLQLYKRGTVIRFFKVFIYFIIFESGAALISKYILNNQFCTDFSAGRGWGYSMCFPGAIFSGKTRLTGFGGEPAIFATYISIAIVAIWWPQIRRKIPLNILLTVVLVIAGLTSESTTGLAGIIIAVTLIPFQNWKLRSAPLLLTVYASTIYYLFNTRIIHTYTQSVITDKYQKNKGSILDRNLNLGLSDYFSAWGKYPFGSQWNGSITASNRNINLFAESLSYGPIVILLFSLLIVVGLFFSKNRIKFLSAGIIVFASCLLVEPAWANAIWFVLIFNFIIVNEIRISNPSSPRTKSGPLVVQ